MHCRRIEGLDHRQILFIQGGGGHDVHDAWDDKLAASLRHELGADHEIRYPRMPGEDDPSYAKWAPAIRREMAALSDGAVLAGHSIGGTMLLQALAEQPPPVKVSMILLISVPFVGEGGWPPSEFEFPRDLGAKLPAGMPVHIFQGLEDDTAPPKHADLYAKAIPQAEVHRLPGRDHQLNNDLREVAEAIRAEIPVKAS
jgi:hypothetical protein